MTLITHVLEYDQVFGIKRFIPVGASLVKQVLCDEYFADIPVMNVLGKELAHVPRLGLVQKIVQHDQSRTVTRFLEIRDAL
jgi:hypothetical protein